MNKILNKYDVTLSMNCQVDGCKEDVKCFRIETLEKPKIKYSFTITTNLCALHGSQLDCRDTELDTGFWEEIKQMPLTA